jgi:hypothetical protein
MNLRGNRIVQTAVGPLCKLFCYSQQAFYQKERNIKEQTQQNLLVLDLIAAIRHDILG